MRQATVLRRTGGEMLDVDDLVAIGFIGFELGEKLNGGHKISGFRFRISDF